MMPMSTFLPADQSICIGMGLYMCSRALDPEICTEMVLTISPQVLSQAGAYAKEEVCRTLVVHISNAPKLHAYAARQAFRSLQEHQKDTNLLLLTTTAWLLGDPPAP